jgi:hypothetical protein
VTTLVPAACGNPYPCECPSQSGFIEIKVIDQNEASIPNPSFTENGQPLTAECDAGSGLVPDGATNCIGWRIFLSGYHNITITAPGYAPQVVAANITVTGGCCGTGDQIFQTVAMAPSDSGCP